MKWLRSRWAKWQDSENNYSNRPLQRCVKRCLRSILSLWHLKEVEAQRFSLQSSSIKEAPYWRDYQIKRMTVFNESLDSPVNAISTRFPLPPSLAPAQTRCNLIVRILRWQSPIRVCSSISRAASLGPRPPAATWHRNRIVITTQSLRDIAIKACRQATPSVSRARRLVVTQSISIGASKSMTTP